MSVRAFSAIKSKNRAEGQKLNCPLHLPVRGDTYGPLGNRSCEIAYLVP